MGGCASKPKDLDTSAAPVPESPTSPNNPEGMALIKEEVLRQENDNEGETKKEEPLVDISEPAKEEETAKSEEITTDESKTTTAEVVKPTEEPKPAAEAEAAKEEPKKEEPKKEEEEKKKEAAAEVIAAAPAPPAKVLEENVTSPKTEDKSDAPLVTV